MARIAQSAIEATRGGPVRGMIPAVDTVNGERVVHLIPWDKASRQGRPGEQEQWKLPDPTEADLTAAIIDTLPREAHVPHRERKNMILKIALRDRLALGHWPKSVEDQLRLHGWKTGNPTLLQEAEAFANRVTLEAANRQREIDQHQVTSDHARRYSA